MKRLTPNVKKKLSSFNTHTEHPTWPTKHEDTTLSCLSVRSWTETNSRLEWALAFFSLFSYTRTILGYLILGDIPRKTRFPPHTPVCIFSQLGTVWREKRKEQQVQQQTKKNSPLNFLICWENPWGFYTTSLRQFF